MQLETKLRRAVELKHAFIYGLITGLGDAALICSSHKEAIKFILARQDLPR